MIVILSAIAINSQWFNDVLAVYIVKKLKCLPFKKKIISVWYSEKFVTGNTLDGWEISNLTRNIMCLFSLYSILYLLDIAVGAPYEEGTGVVYIYNGNTPRMEDKYSQRILGKDIRVGVSGFGYYISKFGEDLDENKYNGN